MSSSLKSRGLTISGKVYLLLFWLVVLPVASLSLGSDAGWDLRNYHLYDPFAILNGRFETDLYAAQLQSFLILDQDFVLYLLRKAILPPRTSVFHWDLNIGKRNAHSY